MNKEIPADGFLQKKFADKFTTASGEPRAVVELTGVKTLWFNTGTLCNITCANCYIESSPENDRLVYMDEHEVEDYLNQIKARNWPTTEIGFTGGEPFMNPRIIEMARLALARGFEVLILTNAMRPMMRKRVQDGLIDLQKTYGDRLTLRVSLDHFEKHIHDQERGTGAWQKTLKGMRWLRDNGIKMAVAGRSVWADSDHQSRKGYAALFRAEGFKIDSENLAMTVLFPEMDETVDVPEITTACWGILNKSPDEVMCANSRMVVKRRGAEKPVVLACTLLAYTPEFELGETLQSAEKPVHLNHHHCAKFCVLGGASCSA
ncbi:MAG: radical SAM protein [Rhodobacteraceae bacterium]|nr:radical SAM protein [Paracoccaceae bacterium]